MARYGMAIDLRTCMGCAACVVACKVENQVGDEYFRCRIEQRSSGDFPNVHMEIFSQRCNQCSEAPCVWNCPTGASHYSGGGVVLVDDRKCTGCKACLAACAYDARFINGNGTAEKCTFCLHRVEQGQSPACVATCPSRAMIFGDLENPQSELSTNLAARNHKSIKPETGNRPNVFYLE